MINKDGVVCKCNETCNCQANLLRNYIENEGEELSGHSYMSPSSLHIKLKCPASASRSFLSEKRKEFVRDNLTYRTKDTNKEKVVETLFAEDDPSMNDGTILHSIFEECLLNQVSDKDEIRRMVLDSSISEGTKEDTIIVDGFPERVEQIVKEVIEADWYACEFRMKIPALSTFGTVDLVFRKKGVLYVYDLKTGRQKVEAEGNEQFLTYTIGLLHILKLYRYSAEVELGVVAVRFQSSTFRYNVEQVIEIFEDFQEKFWKSHTINPEAIPGTHCLYCKAKLFCNEWKDLAEVVIKDNEPSFDQLSDRFSERTTESLVDDYMILKAAERHIKEFKQELLDRSYNTFEGMTDKRVSIVTPKPTDKYVDEDKALAVIKDKFGDNARKFVETKLKPAKYFRQVASDVMTEAQLAEVVTQQPRKPYIKMT